jgi:Holliday junction DNA helicase RuvB
VGQPRLKEHLEILLGAARRRAQAVDHVLFAGPPGLGKTTLAGIVATEMDVALRSTSGPALERAGDLVAILGRAARILGVVVDQDGASEIARRSRGTPRIANRLLRRVRDYAEMRGDGTVDAATARAALLLFEVDDLGLDKVDRAVLTALCRTFAGQPVGLHTLAVAVAEEPETVEEVYEPFLLSAGLLQRTPRGRVATAAAFAHLGLAPPPGAGGAPNLFAG